ncbi:hypothetical protein EON65_15695 [archaeon]|nr:MAG: hypothetical protein EON65_15695 [archaeon]
MQRVGRGKESSSAAKKDRAQHEQSISLTHIHIEYIQYLQYVQFAAKASVELFTHQFPCMGQ